MERDPTRVCERQVGLGDVEVPGIENETGEPLQVHIRRRTPRPDCARCGGPLWTDGEQPGTTTVGRQRIKEPEQEVRELRRVNAILKSASAFFAAELDSPRR